MGIVEKKHLIFLLIVLLILLVVYLLYAYHSRNFILYSPDIAATTNDKAPKLYEASGYGGIDENSTPSYKMLDKKIGYIRLPSFNSKTAGETKEAIEALKKQGMKKLILDLRHNPGGLLTYAVEVSELFLKKGSLIVRTTVGPRERATESKATKNGIVGEDTRIAVLVNLNTASEAEVVAGTLQYWKKATIVGKITFGDSIERRLSGIMDGTGYYLPSGRCVNYEGVIPNIEVEQKETGDAQLEVALKHLRGKL